MENKKPTIKQYCELIEKAIDLAQSKGAYTKMDSVNIVNALNELYKYVERHENPQTKEFKAIPESKSEISPRIGSEGAY